MFKQNLDSDIFSQPKRLRTGDREAKFLKHLTELNEQFAAWIQQQCKQHSTELWTDGVEDYLQYSKDLISDFQDVLDENKCSTQEQGSKAPQGPSLGGFSSQTPTSGPGFLLGASCSQAGGATTTFAALPSTGAAFSFGAAPAVSGFGMGPSPGAGAGDEDDDEGGEQQAEEPSIALAPGDVDILLKQRIKLLSNQDKKWVDKGAGTLSLRRSRGAEAAGKRPYVVFTTDSGRVLINGNLTIKPTVNAKTPANLAIMLMNMVDGKQEQGMHIVKCADAGAAKELRSKIEEFL